MSDDDEQDSFPWYARILGWIAEHLLGHGKDHSEQ
jgi:hypothetical protein